MPRVLIVAYGNPLRSDDGVGWVVAEELRRRLASPEVEVLQLAATPAGGGGILSRAEAVIFVDASRDGEPGECALPARHAAAGESAVFPSALSRRSPRTGLANYMAQLRKPSALLLPVTALNTVKNYRRV